MKIAACVFALLVSGLASAEEVLILANGTRMPVLTYEVKDSVVLITTVEGKLRSLPRSYVDLDATAKAQASAPASESFELPASREERVRWAIEHYGPSALLEFFHAGIDEGMAKNDALPPEVAQRIAAAYRGPFGADRVFSDATAEFLRQAPPGDVDLFFSWLESPATRKVLRTERWTEEIVKAASGELQKKNAPPSSPKRTARTPFIERLDHATDFFGSWHDVFLASFAALVESYRTEAPTTATAAMDAAASPPMGKRDDLQADMRSYLEIAYAALSPAELEHYVRYWESPNGRLVSATMKNALLAAFRTAGGTSGREVASLFREMLPAGDAPPAPLKAAATSKFEELQFQFTPKAGWAPFDVGHLGPHVVLALLRSNPRVVFMILAENASGGPEFTSASAASVIRASLETGNQGFHTVAEGPFQVQGMDGILMISDASVMKRDARYIHWIHARQNFIYQLVVWGFNSDVDLERLKAEASDMWSGFELIGDAPTPAVTASSTLLGNHRSEVFGYRMELEGSGWSRWEGIEKESPGADLAGLRDTEGFILIPLPLGSLVPSMEALARGLLTRLDIDYFTIPKENIRPIDENGYRGISAVFERTVSERPYRYRLNVYRTGGFGYLVAAWTATEKLDVVDDLQRRFKADPEHELPRGTNFPEAQRIDHALVLNEIGLDYYNNAQYGSAAEYFDRAAELAPNDPAMLTNLMSALSATGRFEDAFKALEPRLSRFPDNLDVQSYRPFLLARLGRREESAPLYQALFAKGYQNDEDIEVYAEMLWEMDRKDEALREIEAYRRTRDSIAASRLAALLYGRNEDHDREIAILSEKYEAYPAEIGLALDLLDAYLGGERSEEAAALADKIIAKGGASANVHFLKGRAELALGRHAEAKRSFQAALDLDSSHGAARKYLDHVSGFMGQGNQEPVRRPLEPVPLPERLASVPPPLPASEQGAYYQMRATAISFLPGKEYRRTDRYRVKLTEPDAVPSFSSFQFELDPGSERLYVNELRVLDASGKLVAEGDPASYYVTDDASGGAGREDQILTVPVPGLEAGHSIELTLTRQRIRAPERMPFLAHLLTSAYPVQKAILHLTGDVDAIRYRGERVAPPAVADESVTWVAEAPPLYRSEGFDERVERYLPFVWVGDRNEGWEAIGRTYLEDIGERLPLDSETERLAATLVAGLPGREERVRSIADYVQKNFTYKAIEFGRRAWLPNPAAQVVRNKYGDCKDLALLFYSLLRAVDEPAELVLVSARSEIQPDVPSFDQFDHMIVYSGDYRGGHFFDLTDKDHDVSDLPPAGLGGKQALLLDPARPRLVQIPDYPEDSSRVRSERQVTARGKDLVVEEVLTLHGYYGAWIRAALKGRDTATRHQQIQSYLDAGGSALLEELDAQNVTEAGKPLVLRVRYRIAGALHQADERLVVRIPAIWEKAFLDMTSSEERHTPYLVAYPLAIESETRVTAPDGYRIANAPPAEEGDRSVLAPWRVSTELSNDALVVRSESLRPGRRGPPEEYRDLAETIARFLDAAQPSVVLARTERAGSRDGQ